MRRLNVQESQIDECIQKKMFAVHSRPTNPEIKTGELLLLQLVQEEAAKAGKLSARIDFAIEFDRLEHDADGSISRTHWPNAGRVWEWIIYGSAIVPTIPFSLENLDLSKNYSGQTNPRYIEPADEKKILPYIQFCALKSEQQQEIVTCSDIVAKFGMDAALSALHNFDKIAAPGPAKHKTVQSKEFQRNTWLSDLLKSCYGHRCQICKASTEEYGASVAEVHHIHYLSNGGADVSANMIVLCPTHHRLIHSTNAQFNWATLSYEYPNGVQEKLALCAHLEKAAGEAA